MYNQFILTVKSESALKQAYDHKLKNIESFDYSLLNMNQRRIEEINLINASLAA